MKTLWLWLTGNPNLKRDEVAVEFRKRHSLLMYVVVLPWLLGMLLAYFREYISYLEIWILVLLLINAFYLLIYYRCPRCGSTPISSQFGTIGILLFPKKCAKCKAPLLPDHRWGQD